MLKSRRCCERCGHPVPSKPYTMSVDPDKPGWFELAKQWFSGEWSLLSFLAVVGPLVFATLAVVALFA